MLRILAHTSAWREVVELVDQKRSVIMIGPRSFGKWTLLEELAKARGAGLGVRSVVLTSRLPPREGDLDYSMLWDIFRGQLGVKSRLKVATPGTFLSAVQSVFDTLEDDLIVFVGGCGRGHEENHYRLLSTFQRLLGTGRLTIVGTDDYSSFYYQKQNFLLSDLHSFSQVQIWGVTQEEIQRCLLIEATPAIKDTEVISVAAQISALSGGHAGLVQELLRALQDEGWPPLGERWDTCVRGLLKRSVVLDAISHALEEDPEGYSRTALEYRTAACPEQNSPRIHVLRQLGVLQREKPPLVRLHEGAITNLVEQLFLETNAAKQHRVGTVLTEAGPRLFKEGSIELSDDDLIVLHISDLHVSELYKHRLTWRGGQQNPNEQSSGELLCSDLETLGFKGRVDAVVISGDLVWAGEPAEFRRAKEVVAEIAKAAGVDLSSVLIVPGNHDVEWNPGSLTSTQFAGAVSRESFDDFLQLLGKAPVTDVDVVEVESRSGHVKLQILGIDSNRVEGPLAAGIGFVSRESLSAAAEHANRFRRDCDPNCASLIWLVVHHHIFPASSASLSDAQGRRVTILANSSEILDWANQLKIEAILHGHEHQPSVTVARRWPVDVGEVFTPITSIGAGSFGVKREHLGPFSRNHYYAIVRRLDGILIRSRQQGSGGVKFVPHSDMWLPR